jgi:hypothetical protein
MHFKDIFCLTIFGLASTSLPVFAGNDKIQEQLNPRGKVHIPIGIANTLDTLKTFVEAEGNFSPGVGSYGIYFWLFDKNAGSLFAPTMDSVKCEHGLADGKYLIPFSKWSSGDITVKTEVCEVKRSSPKGEVFIVGSRVTLENTGKDKRNVALYVALRALGPAGFDVKKLTVSKEGYALLVDDHPAIVAITKPSGAGVLATDTIGKYALQGRMSKGKSVESKDGNCSGALQFGFTLAARATKTLHFVCPVLPGRRAVGHKWDGVSQWAQFDLAKLNPPVGGVLQPDAGLQYYRKLDVTELFNDTRDYWKQLVDRVRLNLPDKRWEGAFAAIIGHAAMEMNEGAPDVAVVNYNVFNRDGVYVANIFQKSGNMDLATEAIDYFTKHPFNGRSYPEADNPGQILWVMDQQWQFTRDKTWLKGIYPAAGKIAEMIEYYRTTSGPHWVQMDSLDFGAKLPKEKRRELKPGRCDGHHPEYTEAFDIAGLRSAAILADALGLSSESAQWRKLASCLLEAYDNKFGGNPGKGYGGFSVLWPCRLYPIDSGKAYDQFKGYGKQNPSGWRYFPLAKAHQGLLTGNREAGYGTLQLHLDHEQMRGWYAFDEGGRSGSGGWGHVRTTWNGSVAMPHGWAIAEVWLLLRDCLVFEADQRLVLFSGVSPVWFAYKEGITIENMPTWFGKLNMHWKLAQTGATLRLDGEARPPKGFVLRLPVSLKPTIRVGGQTISVMSDGGFALPPGTKEVHVSFRRKAF